MKKLLARLRAVPHLFSKLTVIYCVGFASFASVYALRTLARTGNDPAALLGIIMGFFGGELMLLCLRNILKKPKGENENENQLDEETYEP